ERRCGRPRRPSRLRSEDAFAHPPPSPSASGAFRAPDALRAAMNRSRALPDTRVLLRQNRRTAEEDPQDRRALALIAGRYRGISAKGRWQLAIFVRRRE